MVDLNQYPHKLFRFVQGESTLNNNGEWVAGTASWIYVSECRLDSVGISRSMVGDGQQGIKTATIYAPANIDSTQDLTIRVQDGDNTIYEGVSINHRATRLHTTINAQ